MRAGLASRTASSMARRSHPQCKKTNCIMKRSTWPSKKCLTQPTRKKEVDERWKKERLLRRTINVTHEHVLGATEGTRGIRKTKVQLQLKLVKDVKGNGKDLSSLRGNESKPRRILTL